MQRSASAFGEDGDFGFKVVAGLEVRLLLIFLVDAFVVGAHADDAVAVVEQFGAGESGEDGDARLFHFAAEPLHEFVDRDDVIAMIAQRRRRDGQFELAVLGKEVDGFLE